MVYCLLLHYSAALAATLANTVQHLRCGREIPARLVTKDEIDYRNQPNKYWLKEREIHHFLP